MTDKTMTSKFVKKYLFLSFTRIANATENNKEVQSAIELIKVFHKSIPDSVKKNKKAKELSQKQYDKISKFTFDEWKAYAKDTVKNKVFGGFLMDLESETYGSGCSIDGL